jgi:hypothetical protein
MEAFERTFREVPLGAPPTGVFVGRHRGFLLTAGARRLDVRALDTVLFVWPEWGIDFDRNLWWFGRREFATGRFRVERGPSRWRDAEVYQLHYDVSRLPIRGLLYDEVKTLEPDRAIGIGGTNHPRGRGDHFWFELNRL